MLVEEHRVAAVDTQPLPHAVAEHEPRVEDGDHRLGPALQLPVHIDEDGVVARVVVILVHPMDHLIGHPEPLLAASTRPLGSRDSAHRGGSM